MRGDRHWGTSRRHNKPQFGKSSGLTKRQRAATLYAIGNRGPDLERPKD